MRKYYQILTTALLLAALSACGGTHPIPPQQETAAQSAPPQEIRCEELRVELQREGRDAAELMAALRTLPEQLQAALAQQGVFAEEISLSVGASPEATVQALRQGGVDLAFLPASFFAGLEQPPRILLARGGGEGMLLAGNTAYGENLAARENWTWEELDRAHWAVEEAWLPALDLWLADHYRGNTSSDLTELSLWKGGADLPADADLLVAASQEGAEALARTERLYETVAAADDALAQEGFSAALAAALETLESDLFGRGYEVVDNDALDPMRRLGTLQSE